MSSTSPRTQQNLVLYLLSSCFCMTNVSKMRSLTCRGGQLHLRGLFSGVFTRSRTLPGAKHSWHRWFFQRPRLLISTEPRGVTRGGCIQMGRQWGTPTPPQIPTGTTVVFWGWRSYRRTSASRTTPSAMGFGWFRWFFPRNCHEKLALGVVMSNCSLSSYFRKWVQIYLRSTCFCSGQTPTFLKYWDVLGPGTCGS